jgi:multiple antibiotic resistance protein
VVLVGFTIFGEHLLRLLHISLPAFQISGGLLLFWIAYEMVFEIRSDRKQRTADAAAAEDHVLDVAAFPLAIPLIAGPGSIAAAMLLSSQHADSAKDLTALCLIEMSIIALTYVAFRGAGLISHVLGRTGTIVLTRLLGIVLAALAIEALLAGIRGATQTVT